MKSRVLHSSYVIDFLDIDFSSNEISQVLELETDEILKQVKNDSLKDWKVQFRGIYGKGLSIRIFKKMPSYPKDRQKEITVHIPIPTSDVVSWGVNPDQQIEVARHPNEAKNAALLDVNFSDFANRTDYILNCFRRAINFCFEDGFTINGVKVKI
jgi:Immunity protein 9